MSTSVFDTPGGTMTILSVYGEEGEALGWTGVESFPSTGSVLATNAARASSFSDPLLPHSQLSTDDAGAVPAELLLQHDELVIVEFLGNDDAVGVNTNPMARGGPTSQEVDSVGAIVPVVVAIILASGSLVFAACTNFAGSLRPSLERMHSAGASRSTVVSTLIAPITAIGAVVGVTIVVAAPESAVLLSNKNWLGFVAQTMRPTLGVRLTLLSGFIGLAVATGLLAIRSVLNDAEPPTRKWLPTGGVMALLAPLGLLCSVAAKELLVPDRAQIVSLVLLPLVLIGVLALASATVDRLRLPRFVESSVPGMVAKGLIRHASGEVRSVYLPAVATVFLASALVPLFSSVAEAPEPLSNASVVVLPGGSDENYENVEHILESLFDASSWGVVARSTIQTSGNLGRRDIWVGSCEAIELHLGEEVLNEGCFEGEIILPDGVEPSQKQGEIASFDLLGRSGAGRWRNSAVQDNGLGSVPAVWIVDDTPLWETSVFVADLEEDQLTTLFGRTREVSTTIEIVVPEVRRLRDAAQAEALQTNLVRGIAALAGIGFLGYLIGIANFVRDRQAFFIHLRSFGMTGKQLGQTSFLTVAIPLAIGVACGAIFGFAMGLSILVDPVRLPSVAAPVAVVSLILAWGMALLTRRTSQLEIE